MPRILPLTLTLLTLPACAQQPPLPVPPPHQLRDQVRAQARDQLQTMQLRRPRADQSNDLNIIPPGTWWRYPETIRDLTLSPDQQKRMDEVFRQNRIQLIDLKASLEKEQLNLDPILNGNPPDTNKALAQISHIADLRADLEKANAKMLLGLRAQLTADQWTKLQTLHPGASFSIPNFSVNMPRMSSHHIENRNSTTTTCTDGKDGTKQDCTTVTVNFKEAAGKRLVTTCVQTPGQATPKCTTNPAGPADGSFNLFVPQDGLPTPPPATFTRELPNGDNAA